MRETKKYRKDTRQQQHKYLKTKQIRLRNNFFLLPTQGRKETEQWNVQSQAELQKGSSSTTERVFIKVSPTESK